MERKHHNVDHLSDEWFALRIGRFTSSRAGEILANGKAKDSVGLTFYSYICETVENEIFGEEDSFENEDTLRGNELEPVAFEIFRQRMLLDFIQVTKCGFFTLGDHEGSSPDCLVGGDAVGEIKAPRRSKFFKIVKNGLSAVDKDWILQIQHQMRVTDRKRGYLIFIWVSDDGVPFVHHLEVDRDKAVQDKFDVRVPMAIKEKLDYKEFLINKFEL